MNGLLGKINIIKKVMFSVFKLNPQFKLTQKIIWFIITYILLKLILSSTFSFKKIKDSSSKVIASEYKRVKGSTSVIEYLSFIEKLRFEIVNRIQTVSTSGSEENR